MNCCVDCFTDIQIQTMIRANHQTGDCSFCKHENVFVYSIDEPSDLSDLISEIVNVYEEFDEGEPLYQILTMDWNVFNKNMTSTYQLIEAFCVLNFGSNPDGYNKNVRLPHDYIEKYGIFSGHSWNDFSKVIKQENRFYNSFFRADQFVSFLSYAIKKYHKGTTLYRARIWNEGHGYSTSELGSPPLGKRKSGRVNPEGIGVLYLTTDERTALNEVRASNFDFVSVGSFQLKKDIVVVNISGLNQISPVLYSSALESLAANIKVFSEIAIEIAKPLRRTDSSLEYLPTQYITEFIKSKGYSGVEYASTMGTGGTNIAVFDESLFECIDVHHVEIKKIDYSYEEYLAE